MAGEDSAHEWEARWREGVDRNIATLTTNQQHITLRDYALSAPNYCDGRLLGNQAISGFPPYFVSGLRDT